MPVTLTRSHTGDVAVISVDREPSVRFLCRSLCTGSVFADYPAVLIDLRRAVPLGPRTRKAIETATHECLSRRQLLGVVEPGEHVGRAVVHARQSRRLLQRPASATTTVLNGVVDVLAEILISVHEICPRGGRDG